VRTTDVPEWAQPGKTVYVERIGGIPHVAWMGPYTVERVTKTRIVLNDGDSYPIWGLFRSEGTYAPNRYLKPLNAETRSAVRAQNRARRAMGAYSKIPKPLHDWEQKDYDEAIAAAEAFIAACRGEQA
jgi:hypothetical protein